MDETGLRVAGEMRRLQVIGDETVTAYRLGARGAVWQGYSGTAVYDSFASYGNAMADEAEHVLCNAHLLRNLEEGLSNWKRSWTAGWPACSGCCLRATQPSTGTRRPHPGTPSWNRCSTTTRAVPAGLRPPSRPQPGPGPVEGAGGRPAVPGRPSRALHPQPDGAGPAHGQAAHEDCGVLPHADEAELPQPVPPQPDTAKVPASGRTEPGGFEQLPAVCIVVQ